MKVLLLLAAMIMAFVPIQIHGSPLNFGEMVFITTGRPFWPYFNSYGCSCDYDGKGTPKDAIDRCCFVQNCCYYDLEKRGCDTKYLDYEFTSDSDVITCAGKKDPEMPANFLHIFVDHMHTGDFTGAGANQDSCKKELCQCDKAAAECFGQNRKSFSKRYQDYPAVLCNGKPLKC